MATNGKEEGASTGYDQEEALKRIRTAGSVSIPPELFEQLYLSPQNAVKGDLRKTFANPTPVALIGFLMCTTPLSMVLLGWRGVTGFANANIGTYFFFGGMLLILGGVGEFLLGNSFPCVVFLAFGAFWFTFGTTLDPRTGAMSTYVDPTNPSAGAGPSFYISFAYFLVAMVMMSFVFTVAALRTNVILFLILLLLIPTFSLLAAAFFQLAEANMDMGTKLQHAGAGCLLALSLLGWYIEFALVLAGVDFPVALPLGDLSTIIKGASDRAKAKTSAA